MTNKRIVLISLLIIAFLWVNHPFTLGADTGITPDNSGSDLMDDFGDDFEEDTFDDAFSDSEEDSSRRKSLFSLPEFIKLNGDLTVSVVSNISHESPPSGKTDWRGLSSLKTELFLEADIDLPSSWKAKVSGSGFYDPVFSIKGRDDYEETLLDEEESDVELRKAWISGKLLGNLDIKAGRQIVVWGKSDTIRVTDVLNPLNMKIPGMTDLEDMRLPTCMTRLDYYLSSFSLSAIAVHERRFNESPVAGSDFYIFSMLTDVRPTSTIREVKPTNNSSNTEYGLKLSGTFTGWDLSFSYADYYDKNPYFVTIDWADADFELRYSRQTMIGGDINIALGNFLIKAESALLKNVNFSDHLSIDSNGLPYRREIQKRFSQTKALGGVEYSGFTDTAMSLEVMNTHTRDLDDHTKSAGIEEDTWETAIRADRNFMNERLNTAILAILYGEQLDDGSVIRITADYDITDRFVMTIGTILYDSSELTMIQAIEDNDRVYTNFEYTF